MVKIIALLIVMLLINVFMIFAVKRAFDRVDDLIRKYFLKKMAALGYITPEVAANDGEEVVEAPVVESQEPAIESNTIVISNPTYMVSSTIENADYKNVDFKEEYKTLKNEMDFDKQQLVTNIIESSSADENDARARAAYDVDRNLPYETIYSLSTLSPEDQIRVLSASFNDAGNELLQYYIDNELVGDFDVLNFTSYTKQLAELYDPNFYVKTGWRSDNFNELGDNVVTMHDDDICEGIKVVHKNKLFDYSI